MAQGQGAMDDETLVLTNGRILAGASFATSVTLRGGRIVALDSSAPAGARVVDLAGRLAIPGFIDNHLHFVKGSLELSGVQLRDATSVDDFARRVADAAQRAGRGAWITGGGWDEQRWTVPLPPSKTSVDALTPHNPVFVTRLDLHMGLANSVALALAGISRETPDPPGGAIVRDSKGEPTGLLKDAAMPLVQQAIPRVDATARRDAIRKGLREAARLGVTSFCDMGMSAEAFDDFRAWQQCDRVGELTARVWMYLPAPSWERLRDSALERGFGSDRLRIAGVKGFADGSLGSSTAAFREPFEGDACNCGLLMEPMLDGSMAAWIAGADAHELQLAIHAIGDRANAEVLSIFESLGGHRERRHRIEHAQHLDAELVRRFAAGKVVAAMQPYHCADDGRWAAARIGASRAAWSFPFRALLDAGAAVTFGSDWPVAPLDPIAGVHAAVTRQTIDGRNPGGWIPEQRITVEEALRCYTTTGAWALFAEREIGTIAPGMRADLAVLSHDLFSISPDEIGDTTVDMTIADGHIVHEE